jgi:hypothetical protein
MGSNVCAPISGHFNYRWHAECPSSFKRRYELLWAIHALVGHVMGTAETCNVHVWRGSPQRRELICRKADVSMLDQEATILLVDKSLSKRLKWHS